MLARLTTLFVTFLVLIASKTITAQVSWIEDSVDAFYYGVNGPIHMGFDSSVITMHFDSSDFVDFDISALLESYPFYDVNEQTLDIFLPDTEIFPDFDSLILQYDLEAAGVNSIFPGMKVKGAPVEMTVNVVVKKEKAVSFSDLASGIKRFDDNLNIEANDELSDDVFFFQNDNPAFSFALIQQLFNEGLISWGQPDFIVDVCSFNLDPLYDQQYQLKNVGQVIDGEQILAGLDVNVEEAWNITKGNYDVSVAVLDDGVRLHEDLYSVSDFDIFESLSIAQDAYHGMACAGLIAAAHNNTIGMKGVAPYSRIYSDPVITCGVTVSELAKSFYRVAHNNISIVNNSWGFTSIDDETGERSPICDRDLFPSLTDAIRYTAREGRDGLGTTIIFSAGNSKPLLSDQCVTYPANLPDVISVGSVLPTGERANYSPIDYQLDFVIPSSAEDGRFGVLTLDQMNHLGVNEENYNYEFGGTSASAPILSGIVALMLSVNPELSNSDIYGILEQTVEDLGEEGRDEFFGLGIPDAFEAVKYSQDMNGQSNMPCPESLNLNGTGLGPLYSSASSIESSQSIIQFDVSYGAGDYILLEPSFSVAEGFVFEALIEECNQ